MTSPPRGLERHLGLWSIVALVVGEVIAVGIFLTPAGMARSLGSPFWVLVVWLIMGLGTACGALCYGELSARFPEAGGGYVYIREAFGPALAFLYGWKCLLVMDPGITAALAVGLTSYLGYVVSLSPLALKLVPIAVVVSLALANMAGVKLGARIVGSLTAIKIGSLAAIVILAVVLGRGDWSNFVPFVAQRAGSEPLPGALAPALVSAFFAFGGWWEIGKLAGEARDPDRAFPLGLVLGVALVTLIYLVTSAAFLYLVPLEQVTSGEAFAAQAGERLFGGAGARVFATLVIVSVSGSLAALLMALPRVYYAMSRDGVFFRGVGVLHPRFGTPTRAIAVQAVLASLLIAIGTFDQIIAYFIFATVAFLGLTVASLFVLRRRSSASFRTPGYPATPIVFLAMVAVLLFLLAAHSPLQAGLGIVVVSVGVPVYYLVTRRRLRRAESIDNL